MTLLLLTACSSQDVGEDTLGDVTSEEDQQALEQKYEESKESDSTEKSTSIKGLLGLGKAMHCSYRQDMGGMTARQDVYIDGENYRVEMETNLNGVKTASYMMRNDDAVYIWNPEALEGMKMTQEFLEEQGAASSFDLTETNDYDCQSWTASQSMFEEPSDVEFMDYGTMVQGMDGAMG
ncbi:MAG: hypothetical protein ACQESE_05150 [Nanobdellota archaeon]